MIRCVAFVFSALVLISEAYAVCIINRTQETVAYVRGEPFAGMETYFAGTIRPGSQTCRHLSPRIDGTYPVSVYTMTRQGSCTIVRGCFYGSEAQQLFYNGAASSSCPIAFRDNTCN